MIGQMLLAAMLASYGGDMASTCRNLAHGEHEHNSMTFTHNRSCAGLAMQSGLGVGGTIFLLEKGHAPTWAKVLVYGGLAGAHGWALHHNLRGR